MKHFSLQRPLWLSTLFVALLALPGVVAAASNATAFNSGSGANISTMRTVILTVGISLAVMVCAAVMVQLLGLHQVETDAGQQTVLWYSIRFAILLALLTGVFCYL